MRRLYILPILATLSGCFSGIVIPEPERHYIFRMPEVHGIGKEYLICTDTLAKGASCTFNGLQGTYEEAQDKSFLNVSDSSIHWPNHDGIGPVFVRCSH